MSRSLRHTVQKDSIGALRTVTNENIGNIRFTLIGEIPLQTDADGLFVEYSHQLLLGVRPNLYAAGPFCHFRMKDLPTTSGVYAVKIDSEVKYVGRCTNLRKRFGYLGYGTIAKRNCHHDGQATNCKINALILKHAKIGHAIHLFFCESPDFAAIESNLIALLHPPWNGRQPAVPSTRTS
jgi:hypothetical protein